MEGKCWAHADIVACSLPVGTYSYLGTEWEPATDILWTRGRCGGHLFVLTLPCKVDISTGTSAVSLWHVGRNKRDLELCRRLGRPHVSVLTKPCSLPCHTWRRGSRSQLNLNAPSSHAFLKYTSLSSEFIVCTSCHRKIRSSECWSRG